MALILSFLLFILLCFVAFYLPGRWLLRMLQYKSANTITELTISFGVGCAFFLIVNYLLAWIHLSGIYYVVLGIFILLELPTSINSLRKNFSLRWILQVESFTIFLGVLLMVSATATSGLIINGETVFYGTNAWDGVFHVALIRNMLFQFPPSFPGLSGTFLRGYHILYDFMLSRFTLFFGFTTFDLYFRFFSLFTAIFYGLAGITLSYSLKMDRFTRRVFLFLLFFAQGAEFFIFHWFHAADKVYDSGIVQPAGNIVDPSVLLSIALTFILFVVLFSQKKKQQILLSVLLLGVIPGIKIYTGILAYSAIGCIALIRLIQKKVKYILLVFFSGLISAVIYIPFNIGAGVLIFHPFLFLEHFMQSDTVFTSLQWPLKLQVYEQHHNMLRIIYLYGIAALIYFIPPLGIRLISLASIGKIFTKKFYTSENIFWMIFIGVGILLPIIFIQSIGVFNTVQFFWLIWIALLIPTAISLSMVLGHRTKTKIGLLLCCLIILSLPIIKFPYAIYSTTKLSIHANFSNIAKVVHTLPKGANILVVNRQFKNGDFTDTYKIPVIAALAGRPVYYEPEQADFSQSQSIETMRKSLVDNIAYILVRCPGTANKDITDALNNAQSRYLLIIGTFGCANSLNSLHQITKQSDYSLYKLKQ